MGESSAETVREIEKIRGRLEDELQELETRLPRRAGTIRAIGFAGAGLAGTWLWMRLRRRRNRKEAVTDKALESVVSRLPDQVASRVNKAMEDGQWQPLALSFGALWLLRRLAERRQVRIVRRALRKEYRD